MSPHPNPVPVFLYHSVSDDPPSWIAPFTVTPRVFTEQLDRIIDSGRTVIPLERLVGALRGGPPLPPWCAVLTFDDGFADFYWTVAPQLTERGLPATLYLTTGAVHAPGGPPGGSLLPPAPMLNWRQVSTLDAYGIGIGGHSRTHAQLDTLPRRRLCAEIAGCKRRIEDVLGHPVSAFSYPHGYSSPTVRRAVGAAGWTSATAALRAFSSPADDPLRIARLTVTADTPADLFRQWTEGHGAPVAPFREPLHTTAWRLYRRSRATLSGRADRPLPPQRPC
ncbi:polysaccharide deacetylase family protein [Streptomyces ochraceiscleroticus]|uniref:polysaccharide deacetylase family protein n=1 Tax=Streptomyces ochraceiscleroticus TaxID=47761 RepID=UPI0006921E8D|nr:polysaccharide deacetylase family protein [Streptomyces ochraceiscleroticus]